MKILKQILPRLLIVIVSLFIGYRICASVSFHFFFDKFYYGKSIVFGYLLGSSQYLEPSQSILKQYGERSRATVNLKNDIQNPPNVFGLANNSNKYTIVVIGDSFVWGQGIQERDRFVHILEERLNKIRPTKIISLALPADSLADNYIKYYFYTKNNQADMIIFTFLDNDLLFLPHNHYDQAMEDALTQPCIKPIIRFESITTDEDYIRAKDLSFLEANGNMCVLKTILRNLSIDKRIIFFDYGKNFNDSRLLDIFHSNVNSQNFPLISVPFINMNEDFLHVSKKETHPSAYANQIFADTLYLEIIKKWNR